METKKTMQVRPYLNEQDYAALRSLITAKFADPGRRFYPSLGDLDYIRAFDERFPEKVMICEVGEGTVIGAVWPGHYRILHIVTGPEYTQYESDILVWAEQHFCAPTLLEDRTGNEVSVWAYDEDTVRVQLLKERGYTKHTWYMYSGMFELGPSLPEPQFPPGYQVRPLIEADRGAKINIMGGSAGLTAPTAEIYERLINSPTYQPELDLAVVDDHEQMVGFANVWHDTANHIAIIEPFGTAPTHRRKGLATNLLYECMHRLRARGVSELYINHGGLWTLDPEPDDAMRVYKTAGFQKLGSMFVWCKACRYD